MKKIKVPNYAKGIKRKLLVRIFCKGKCECERVAKVSKFPFSFNGPNLDMNLYATCLICGYKAIDNYNWGAA